jgi:hypothetical protein
MTLDFMEVEERSFESFKPEKSTNWFLLEALS